MAIDEGDAWAVQASALLDQQLEAAGIAVTPVLADGTTATGMDLAMRIVQWLGRPAVDFVYQSTW